MLSGCCIALNYLCMQPSVAHTLFTMDNKIAPRDVEWTDSSDSDINSDLLDKELESDLLPSDEDEVPFARHGPVVEPDSEDVVAQKEFWNHCAIGFRLDYRKFSVPRLQQLINSTKGPWAVDGTLLVLERWRPNLVIGNLQLNFITIWV